MINNTNVDQEKSYEGRLMELVDGTRVRILADNYYINGKALIRYEDENEFQDNKPFWVDWENIYTATDEKGNEIYDWIDTTDEVTNYIFNTKED